MHLVYDLTAKIAVCSTIQMQKTPSNAPVYDLTANDSSHPLFCVRVWVWLASFQLIK